MCFFTKEDAKDFLSPTRYEDFLHLHKMYPIRYNHKEIHLIYTQPEFALRSGLGLRFIRDLEQGKSTVRLDKVNQALTMFGSMAVPGRKPREGENE